MNKRLLGFILIVFGLLFLTAAIFLYCSNVDQEKQAGEASSQALEALMTKQSAPAPTEHRLEITVAETQVTEPPVPIKAEDPEDSFVFEENLDSDAPAEEEISELQPSEVSAQAIEVTEAPYENASAQTVLQNADPAQPQEVQTGADQPHDIPVQEAESGLPVPAGAAPVPPAPSRTLKECTSLFPKPGRIKNQAPKPAQPTPPEHSVQLEKFTGLKHISEVGNKASDYFQKIFSAAGSLVDTIIPGMEMQETLINGYAYIGTLQIPKVSLTLPVMSTWSYDHLNYAPCRYNGTVYMDNFVIIAHNFITHFGPIKELRPGDSVLFTDVLGNEYAYVVAETEILDPNALEELVDSGYAMTLMTCTLGGGSRVAVRCDRA